MAGKRSTGDGVEYDTRDEAIIEAALDNAWQGYDSGSGSPTKMVVTARVEWSGVEQASNGGVRTVRLDDLDLFPVKAKLDKARRAGARAAHSTPATSYQAKGWHAQLRALTGSRHGSEVSDRAGLDPSPRTLRRWLAQDTAPSKANQQKIAEAYSGMRTWQVDTTSRASTDARHELAAALTAALSHRYAAKVRLRDIQSLNVRR